MEILTNEFSWSKSRKESFETCLRRYYFHYYGSRFFSTWDNDVNKREIFIMKNLTSVRGWIGNIVHENISWLIGRVDKWRPATLNDALAKLRKDMEDDWFTSSSGLYREDPKFTLGLREHYYTQEINGGFEWAYSEARNCIQNFFEKSLYSRLVQGNDIKILQTEKIDTFVLDGLKVWVAADLILNWNGWLYIVDWKTGTRFDSENADLQLAIYALYGSKKSNVQPNKIMVHQSNLRLGQNERKQMSSESTDWATEQIRASAAEMKSRLVDPQQNLAREEDFPRNKGKYHCRDCNFLNACECF